MHALTRTVLSHRRAVVVIWLLLAVAGAATARTTIGRLTTSYALAGSPGYAANQRIATLYGNGGAAAPTVAVITLPAGLRIDSRGVAAEAGRVFAAGHAVPHVRIADYATTGNRAFVTAGARSTFALVFTPGNQPDTLQPADIAVARAVQAAAPAGWTVHVTGLRQLENTTPARPGNGVIAEAMLGALGALVVLAFVFASVLAVLPLAVAGVSILTTFLVLRAVTEVTEVSFIAEYLIALVGLGVGIDYSLLVVTRWREQRGRGQDPVAAVHAAMASAGRSVLLSGLVVSAGLLALLALPVPFLHGLAYAGLLIPLVSRGGRADPTADPASPLARRLDWPRRHITPSPAGAGPAGPAAWFAGAGPQRPSDWRHWQDSSSRCSPCTSGSPAPPHWPHRARRGQAWTRCWPAKCPRECSPLSRSSAQVELMCSPAGSHGCLGFMRPWRHPARTTRPTAPP